MNPLSDEQLLAAMRMGNEMALNALLERYRERLYFKCYAFLKDEESALEIVQDIFITLWQKRFSINAIVPNAVEPPTIRIYLYTLARNNCINHLLKQKSYAKLKAYLYDVQETVMEEITDETERKLQWLRKAIKEIPHPSARRAIELVYLDNIKQKDVARIMGVEGKAVRNYLTRARTFLREKLKAGEALGRIY